MTPRSLCAVLLATAVASAGASPARNAASAKDRDAVLVVHADQPRGPVNRDLFGTEIKCAYGGEGLMTGLRQRENLFRPEIMGPAAKLAPGFMRYKFMRGAWCWEDGVGPLEERRDDPAGQKYMGIAEIMACQSALGLDASKCHLVVNPRNPEQSAALVAYLNAPAGARGRKSGSRVLGVSKENGRDYRTVGYWADLRARYGHPEPYGSRWFELGNENYMPDAGFNGDPEAYCASAREVARAMKAVDPSVKCGVNIEAYPTKQERWRTGVVRLGSDFADFLVCHAYYPYGYPRHDRYRDSVKGLIPRMLEELYYRMIMAGAHQALSDWTWFRAEAGRIAARSRELPLCLTENGFQLDIEDAVAQNTVLVGVYDADLIGMIVEHARELNLANACLFYLEGDNPFAFLQHGFEHADGGSVTVRPPYWALYLWTRWFGATLVRTDVECGTFDIPWVEGEDWPREKLLWTQIAAQTGIPRIAAHASLSADAGTLYLVVINRDLSRDVEADIRVEGFAPAGAGEAHTLNSSVPGWDANNETHPGTVRIRDSRIEVPGASFRHSFPAHSATALVLHKR